jgi:hypothetical protein
MPFSSLSVESLKEGVYMEVKPWVVLYAIAFLCVGGCMYIIYDVMITGDPSNEWMIWILFGLTLALVGGGLYMERDHKRGLVKESLD